jgi:hypothetical protein
MLDLLIKLFGKAYVNKIIGTGTNVSKPIKLDKNSPFKLYSDSAFKDSEVLAFIEKKIAEYGPYALSNKNVSEVKNFEMNAQRLLNAKQPKKESTVKSVVESMFGPLGKSDKPTPKPEAEVVDIRTKEKVKPEGIMKLKKELGLPEGVEPGSIADKAIKESVEYKTKQQGVKSILDEDYVPPKSTSLDEDEIADIGARGYSAEIEGKRRAVIRQVLLKDARIDLPEDVRNSLKNYDDLRGGGDESMDPLRVFENYYERDNEVLGTLDGIIDTARNEREAADTFLSMEDNFKPKDLGTKLKDYDGDPDGLAEGGRIGYSVGTKLRIAKFFGDKGINLARELKKAVDDIFPSGDRKLDADVVVDNMLEDLGVDREMFDQKDISTLYGMAYDTLSEGSVPKGLASFVTKKGKGEVKMADEVKVSQDVKDKVEFDKQIMEDNFTKQMAPKMFLRMELKTRFPGITDDMIAKIMADDNPQRIAEVLASMDEGLKMMEKGMSTDEIINTFKNTPRTKNAGGGLNYLMGL